MDRLVYVAMSGAKEIMRAQAANNNNLANVSTVGFRADLSAFQTQNVVGAGLPSRAYATNDSTGWDSTSGQLETTGRSLDVAIKGQGWLAVQANDGTEAYTRAGDLHVDSTGVLMTGTGESVLGDSGPITVPPYSSITIGSDGSVSIVPQGQSPATVSTVGRIKLVNPSVDNLTRGSDGLFRTSDGSTASADAGVQLVSGTLESSNVNIAETMVNMIELARNYEVQVKAMKTAEDDSASSSKLLQKQLNAAPETTGMNSALWTAKTGLDAQQTAMDVISNNLANVNTTGFKKGRAVFQDLLYQNVSQVGAATTQNTQAPSGTELGTGVSLVATEKVYTQGNLNQTGNTLDLAINGNGFFQVLMPDGSLAYTRDGSFQLSATGQIVTASGYAVQPAITIPAGAQSVTIGTDGTVQVQLSGQTAASTVGTLQLANFINPAGLQPNGQDLMVESAASGTAQTGAPGSAGFGSLQQGYVEGSNVNVVEEMVNMIETQRAYEMNTKAIETNDQMLSYLDSNI